MKPITSIGEIVISIANKDFFFKPSFINMSRIGDGEEIVRVYSILNGFDIYRRINQLISIHGNVPAYYIKLFNKPIYGRPILDAAILMMQSCCDDDIEPLVGYYKFTKKGMRYTHGAMPIANIIVIGRQLAEHGIIGKVKRRVLAKNEAKNKYSSEFRVIDYISSARTNFNMSRQEAESLTMTEFQELIKIKFPEDEKGHTSQELEQISDDYFKRKKELIAMEKANAAQ